MNASKTSKSKARATAFASKTDKFTKSSFLKAKYPSDKWFEDVERLVSIERIIEWMQNFKVNRDTIGFKKSVTDLPEIKGSALVIDKSMASTKFFEQIPWIKDYNGTIICCDRALYQVIVYRPPEYVCNLDSSYLCMSFFDRPDVKAIMNKTTAVFAVTTHPLTIRHWHGNRVFFTPYMGSWIFTKTLMVESHTPFLHTGGQVASFAWVLAYNLGANPIGVFGVTNSYDNPQETEYPDVSHRRVTGPHGVCWQDPVFDFYNQNFLELIRLGAKTGVKTVNTMKAGLLYSKNVEDLTLNEFVKKYG